MIDSLLLATTRVLTFKQEQRLTNASGFFFERDGNLFLVTSRHVLMASQVSIYRIALRSNFTQIRIT